MGGLILRELTSTFWKWPKTTAHRHWLRSFVIIWSALDLFREREKREKPTACWLCLAWLECQGVKSESGGNPKQHLPKALVFLESSQPETQTIISRTKQELHCICKCLSMWQCKWEERGKFLQCSYSMAYFGNADNEVYMSSCLWEKVRGGMWGSQRSFTLALWLPSKFFNNNKKIFDLQSWA